MIARAAESDGARILEITRSAGNFAPQDIACVQELWEDYMRRGRVASGYDFWVFRAGEGIQGYASFGPSALTVGTWDIYWLAVDPAARRQGVARALIRTVEEEVSKAKGRLLLIETSGTPEYAAARRFYESAGFRYQAVIHDYYAPDDDLIIFGKVLAK